MGNRPNGGRGTTKKRGPPPLPPRKQDVLREEAPTDPVRAAPPSLPGLPKPRPPVETEVPEALPAPPLASGETSDAPPIAEPPLNVATPQGLDFCPHEAYRAMGEITDESSSAPPLDVPAMNDEAPTGAPAAQMPPGAFLAETDFPDGADGEAAKAVREAIGADESAATHEAPPAAGTTLAMFTEPQLEIFAFCANPGCRTHKMRETFPNPLLPTACSVCGREFLETLRPDDEMPSTWGMDTPEALRELVNQVDRENGRQISGFRIEVMSRIDELEARWTSWMEEHSRKVVTAAEETRRQTIEAARATVSNGLDAAVDQSLKKLPPTVQIIEAVEAYLRRNPVVVDITSDTVKEAVDQYLLAHPVVLDADVVRTAVELHLLDNPPQAPAPAPQPGQRVVVRQSGSSFLAGLVFSIAVMLALLVILGRASPNVAQWILGIDKTDFVHFTAKELTSAPGCDGRSAMMVQYTTPKRGEEYFLICDGAPGEQGPEGPEGKPGEALRPIYATPPPRVPSGPPATEPPPPPPKRDPPRQEVRRPDPPAPPEAPASKPKLGEGQKGCTADADCVRGLVCVDSTCFERPSNKDASAPASAPPRRVPSVIGQPPPPR